MNGAMHGNFGIAGVQMNVSAFENNVERMGNYLRHIRGRFPGFGWCSSPSWRPGSPAPQRRAAARPHRDPADRTGARNRAVADPGSLFERVDGPDGSVVYNTMPVINPQGEIVARFRKLFPFRPYERDVAGGTEFCVFDVPGAGRFGVSICYDMWFPETTRTLAAMGAEVILHPTMTDTIDRDVELAIARASAAQNQVYFFDINGVGDGGVGRSIVCDPSGYVLHQADGGAEIVPISVDFERVRRERELGLRNLGQPLKSFRDRDCDFKVYRRESPDFPYLNTLGPLTKPD